MIYAGSIHVIVNNGSAYMPEVDIKIYKNGTQLKSYSWSTKATDDFYIDVVEWDVIKITLGNTTGQGRTLYARITGTIDGYMPGKKAKIFELKPIGKKATAILLGRLPTGERRDGN